MSEECAIHAKLTVYFLSIKSTLFYGKLINNNTNTNFKLDN